MSRYAAAALALALAACAPTGPTVLARGVLPYALAATPGRLVAVELSERFELVVRSLPTFAETARADLGPSELDVRALAVHDATAYVGDDSGAVRELELGRGAVRRAFRVGAPVVALAADERSLVSADATGAVCLRRRLDGALLQCARAPRQVTTLTLEGSELVLTFADGTAARWSAPALGSAPGTGRDATTPWRDGVAWATGGQVWWRGRGNDRQLIDMASPIRALVVTASGALVVAAWPKSLTDPALVAFPR